jgi:RNA polymerase sigma factor (sigma-70 family)
MRRTSLSTLPAAAPALAPTVQAAARGDVEAWDALVHRFTPMLRGVIRRYRLDVHDVDDVVQACWLSLLVNLDAIRDPEAVGAWLVTTARRQSLRVHQRVVREVLAEAPLGDRRAAPDCVEADLIRAERGASLRAAVDRLPDRQRALLRTLIAEPYRSYAEVSRGLGMPIGSIGPTRERGLRRLRDDERLAGVVRA